MGMVSQIRILMYGIHLLQNQRIKQISSGQQHQGASNLKGVQEVELVLLQEETHLLDMEI